jgi:hypothetical protein
MYKKNKRLVLKNGATPTKKSFFVHPPMSFSRLRMHSEPPSANCILIFIAPSNASQLRIQTNQRITDHRLAGNPQSRIAGFTASRNTAAACPEELEEASGAGLARPAAAFA